MIRIAIDMDGVLCDFNKSIQEGNKKDDPNFYLNLEPINGALAAYKELVANEQFDVHILSSPPYGNPDGWKGKRLWCAAWLYGGAYKKITLTHRKDLFKADYLIDDSVGLGFSGIDDFDGTLIHFGGDDFPDWETVIEYFGCKYRKLC